MEPIIGYTTDYYSRLIEMKAAINALNHRAVRRHDKKYKNAPRHYHQ